MARIAAKAEAKSLAKQGGDTNDPMSLDEMKKKQVEDDEKNNKPKFLSKAERQAAALKRLEDKRKETDEMREAQRDQSRAFLQGKRTVAGESATERRDRERKEREASIQNREDSRAARERAKDIEVIKASYMGVKKVKKKIIKPSEKFAKIFQFDWEAGDDTTAEDNNGLFVQKHSLQPLFGRGYIGGLDMRTQRQEHTYMSELTKKRQELQRAGEESEQLSRKEKEEREKGRRRAMDQIQKAKHSKDKELEEAETAFMGVHWSEKALADMDQRDWRIFREDYDIRPVGGKAPLPIRSWKEASLSKELMDAIAEMKYEKPSPIQMQAIPIGMTCRDCIGLAETGSGKTAAFMIPLISYLLKLPASRTSSEACAEDGPIAVIMAPTRELANQINEEALKLCKFTDYKTCCIVGGQSVEQQGFVLRRGVQIIVATPGRLIDVIESRLCVLNQATYIVLDEADRMIDMGFEPQVQQVLEAMGGKLKSEDESVAELQISQAAVDNATLNLRVTTMFSATMPKEVEKLAKQFLRHPAVVKIGDENSGKNKRIEQRVEWIAEPKKADRLKVLLRDRVSGDKVIVFVNLKKGCDSVARALEKEGHYPVILHGGKKQDEREAALEGFKEGRYDTLVATDVAGRGLDVPDVARVINYDMPDKVRQSQSAVGSRRSRSRSRSRSRRRQSPSGRRHRRLLCTQRTLSAHSAHTQRTLCAHSAHAYANAHITHAEHTNKTCPCMYCTAI
jgi:ATP-dependent RNA helicase DDX23/PRP28